MKYLMEIKRAEPGLLEYVATHGPIDALKIGFAGVMYGEIARTVGPKIIGVLL
jgi:hypothetical protein